MQALNVYTHLPEQNEVNSQTTAVLHYTDVIQLTLVLNIVFLESKKGKQ